MAVGKEESMQMKYVIFGAGMYGSIALDRFGPEAVVYFLDNSIEKQHTRFRNIEIISLQEFLPMKDRYHVVIASIYGSQMEQQLKEAGIEDYTFFLDEHCKYYETEELVFNPYETIPEAETEAAWAESERLKYARKAVYDAVENMAGKEALFNHIEIETINRCNGCCSFCPVNRQVDPREEKLMSEELFLDIVNQLEELDYSGRFTTFSNNEPLLDERIIDFNRYARQHLPKARLHLFTNGTLLTIEKFRALTDVLDELIIDNYQQELKLIKPCAEIAEYCQENPELKKKVTIVLRKPHEILTSRGGNAPNRSRSVLYEKDRCILPFKQMIIRPDGKVSLCCNDALGKYTLGDTSKEKLVDIWYGQRFQTVRKCLYEGREAWGDCKFCDTFSVG